GDLLTVTLASATRGTVAINTDGTLTYTPNADFNGTDTISYTISDGQGGFSTASVTVTVGAINDAPVAVAPLPPRNDADGELVNFNVATDFADPDGEPLRFAATGLPNGLTIDAVTGVVTGTIASNASQIGGGVYTVTVIATDVAGASTSQSFTWTITNPAPDAVNDTASTNEDTPVTITVLGNDTDADGDLLTVTLASATRGTVVINTDGTLTYTPNADFNGTDTISYTISDGQGGFSTASVTVTVVPVNDAPVATNDVAATDEDQPVVIVVLANSSDVDGDPLSVTAAAAANGRVTINADGTIVYTPNADFNGVDMISYTISDGGGGSSTATVSVVVAAVNDAPIPLNDTATTPEDTAIDVAVLPNDSDVDGDTLTITAAVAARGSVTINADGTLGYIPAADFIGTDIITYTISDGRGGTATSTVTVTVTPVNDAPVAVDDVATVTEDGTVVIAVLPNDSDVDGNPLTVTIATAARGTVTINADGTLSYTPNPDSAGVDTIVYTVSDGQGGTSTARVTVTVEAVNDAPVAVADAVTLDEDTTATIAVLANDIDVDGDRLIVTTASATNGVVAINADGTLTYTPNPDFNGVDTILYTISDGNGGTSQGEVAVTVIGRADAPVVTSPLPSRVDSDGDMVRVNVAGAFSDVDSDVVSFAASGLPPGLTFDAPTGVISGRIAADASVGAPYTVLITANDGQGGSVSASFVWSVTNPAPVAANDVVTTPEDTAVVIAPLGNDTDADGDRLTIVSATAPRGIVTINVDGTLSYTPNANFNGTDTISYTISDGQGGFSTASIEVTVTAVNDAPRVSTIVARENADGATIIVPTAAAFADVDGDALTFSAQGLPAGLVIDSATGVISGRIASAASASNGGVYTVVVTASDGNGGTVSTSFGWVVFNPAPTAVNDSATTSEDTAVTIAVLDNDVDPDGDRLSIITASALNGSVTIAADGTLIYLPRADFNGTDTITYTISDGQGGLSTATVVVTVSPVNDAPIAARLPDRSDSDAERIDFNASPAFIDRDGDTLSFSATGLPAGLSIDPVTGIISGIIDRSASQVDGGIYAVSVTASDGRGGTVSSSFTWAIANPAPIAANDVFTTTEDGPITVAVLANDSDPDGDRIFIIAASASRGTVVINADGTLTYTPGADFNGTDVISYTISDGQNGSATSTGTATIIAVNDGPRPVGTLPQRNDNDGESVTVATAGAFRDVDDTDLRYSADGLPAGLTIDAATGVITGTIARDASAAPGGTYAVTITATDPSGELTTQQFNWVIANPGPTAVADSATVAEDSAVVIAVLANDTDLDGDPLVVTTASALHGTVEIRADGTIRYVPAANFIGADTISYTIRDGQGAVSSSTVAVTVTPANDAPASAGLAPRTDVEGRPISFDASTAFADIDRDTLRFVATGLPAGLTIDPATGIIGGMIDPAASVLAGGRYSVIVTATDPAGATASASFVWTVTNPAPIAIADTATTAEDTTVVLTVLENDVDPDGDTLTVVSASAGNGSVTVNADGTLTYTPNANFNGSDTITYTVSDGQGGTSTSVAIVTVTAVNDAPTAGTLPNLSDSNSETVTVPIGAAFSDVDGDRLTFSATGLPAGLKIDPATGAITGTVAADASSVNGGVYTVTVTAADGNGGTIARNFTWTVVNTPPTAIDDVATTTEDTPVTIAVLANDTDPDGNPATPIAVSIDAVAGGTAVVNPDGTITFTPAADFVGLASVTYRIDDGLGGGSTATVAITVTAANDAPTTGGIASRNGSDGDMVMLPIAAAFRDPDGDTLTFSAAGLPAGLTIDPATGVITGTIAFNASVVGGGNYAVVVTATDASGAAVSSSFTWTIANPAPLAVNDGVTTPEDSAVTIDVLANDSDRDGDTLTVVAASAGRGTVTINADGTLRYTPPVDYVGTDTISYTISDGQGGSETASVTVRVTAANDAPTVEPLAPQSASDGDAVSLAVAPAFTDRDGDALTYTATGLPAGLTIDAVTGIISGRIAARASQIAGGIYTVTVTARDPDGLAVSTSFTWSVGNVGPIAANDSATAAEGGSVTIAVLGNDADPDGDTLVVIAAQASNGSVTINADGTLTYAPTGNFFGTDTITYTVSDGQGGRSTASVTVIVTGVNDAPTSRGLVPRSDPAGEVVTLNLAPAFADADGDTLRYTAAGLPPGLAIDPATGVVSGTITAGSAGTYTVVVTVDDGRSGTISSSFSWTVSNVPPVAVNDNVTVAEDTTSRIAVLANDRSLDGDPLVVAAASAARGTVVINADGTLSYTPPADFTGTDTITYTISDGQGGTSTATVTVTVAGNNDAPLATALPPRSDSDGETVTLNLAPAFRDPDGDTLRYSATGLPAGLTIDAVTGVISGQIASNASATSGGVYTVVVSATDPSGAQVSTSFTWTVVNPTGTAVNDTATVAEDGVVTVTVLANDINPDGDPLTVVSATAANGTATINTDGSITYRPSANFTGTDIIAYTIDDGQGGVSTATVTVTVTAVNDAPTTTGLSDRSDADGEVVRLVAAPAFADIDGDTLSYTAAGLPAGLSIDAATGVISGTIARDASVPAAGSYTVTVTATDPAGQPTVTSFVWTITNPAPVAVSDSASTIEGVAVTIPVLANDSDPDGDPIRVVSASALNGIVVVNANNTLTYTPRAGFIGIDALTYTISDGQGASTASVSVTVAATTGNTAPVAADDVATVVEDTPATITVLANDQDPDGDSL
ncbi:Ig-like domain-containing protein, partial [Sphingomonas prati]